MAERIRRMKLQIRWKSVANEIADLLIYYFTKSADSLSDQLQNNALSRMKLQISSMCNYKIWLSQTKIADSRQAIITKSVSNEIVDWLLRWAITKSDCRKRNCEIVEQLLYIEIALLQLKATADSRGAELKNLLQL